jgi:PKD repeat protein
MQNFMMTGLTKLAAGGWRLAAGGWRLAAGGLVLTALSACGGGGGGNTQPSTSGNSTPSVTTTATTTSTVANILPIAAFSATANSLLVAFDGTASLDADGSIASYAWNFGEPTRGAANTAISSTATHAFAASGTYTVTLTVTDNQGSTGTKQLSVVVSTTSALATGKLNDTGITASQCYGAGTDTLSLCSSAAAVALNAAQDGMQGRDAVALTNTGIDGNLGFNFTKIGPSGETLPASATNWSCVKDNVTGLIWEIKTRDGGLRDWTKNYTQYDSTASTQIYNTSTGVLSYPTQADIDAPSNTIAFKNAVNAVGLCGANDWRLPSANELQSVVDYGPKNSINSIDAQWFPNTQADRFWTGTAYVGVARLGWVVGFGFYDGYVGYYFRSNAAYVRLVRGG